jgi:hypothetical protein
LENHAATVIEFVFDGQQMHRRVVDEGDALGEVVAQQPQQPQEMPGLGGVARTMRNSVLASHRGRHERRIARLNFHHLDDVYTVSARRHGTSCG